MFEQTFLTAIVHAARGAMNFHGDVAYSENTIMARVEPYVKQLLNKDGEEFTSSAQVFTKAVVNAGDKLTIDGVTRLVQISSRADSLFGEHTHYEIIL